jgi:hypothetical protein
MEEGLLEGDTEAVHAVVFLARGQTGQGLWCELAGCTEFTTWSPPAAPAVQCEKEVTRVRIQRAGIGEQTEGEFPTHLLHIFPLLHDQIVVLEA